MKIIITLIAFLLIANYTIAQNNIVNIDFEVGGQVLIYKKATVKFINGRDTIIVDVKDKKIIIPELILKKRRTVIFYIDRFCLKFDSIPITLNKLSPKWTVGIEEKPFDKKKYKQVKSWKKVQVIYYLHNDDGRTFTVYNAKKSTVINNL